MKAFLCFVSAAILFVLFGITRGDAGDPDPPSRSSSGRAKPEDQVEELSEDSDATDPIQDGPREPISIDKGPPPSPPFGQFGYSEVEAERSMRRYVAKLITRADVARQMTGWVKTGLRHTISIERSRFGERWSMLSNEGVKELNRVIAPHERGLAECVESAYQLIYADLQVYPVLEQLVGKESDPDGIVDRGLDRCSRVGCGVSMGASIPVGDRYLPFVYCGEGNDELRRIAEEATRIRRDRAALVEGILTKYGL